MRHLRARYTCPGKRASRVRDRERESGVTRTRDKRNETALHQTEEGKKKLYPRKACKFAANEKAFRLMCNFMHQLLSVPTTQWYGSSAAVCFSSTEYHPCGTAWPSSREKSKYRSLLARFAERCGTDVTGPRNRVFTLTPCTHTHTTYTPG